MLRRFATDVLAQIGWRLLKTSAQSLWDGFWSTLFWAIEKAEDLWEESGRGDNKKEWVVDAVMDFAKQKWNLNFITRRGLRVFVGRVVDAALDELNKTVGKDWKSKVGDVQSKLADKIPFVDCVL